MIILYTHMPCINIFLPSGHVEVSSFFLLSYYYSSSSIPHICLLEGMLMFKTLYFWRWIWIFILNDFYSNFTFNFIKIILLILYCQNFPFILGITLRYWKKCWIARDLSEFLAFQQIKKISKKLCEILRNIFLHLFSITINI